MHPDDLPSGRVSTLGSFPAFTLLDVGARGKVSCGNNAVIQVKGVFGRPKPVALDLIGNMYQGSSFGADVRQVRSSLSSAALLDIKICDVKAMLLFINHDDDRTRLTTTRTG